MKTGIFVKMYNLRERREQEKRRERVKKNKREREKGREISDRDREKNYFERNCRNKVFFHSQHFLNFGVTH